LINSFLHSAITEVKERKRIKQALKDEEDEEEAKKMRTAAFAAAMTTMNDATTVKSGTTGGGRKTLGSARGETIPHCEPMNGAPNLRSNPA
jgi:hypothetical protein